MTDLVPYDRPRGAVHDLAHALSLANTGCHVVILSDAALYALQNLAHLDLKFVARWAVEIGERGYRPISKTHIDYDAWRDLVDEIESQLMPVDCEISTGLQAIADAIRGAGVGGAGGTCYPGVPMADCAGQIPSEDWADADPNTEADPDADPPPDGFATWSEYFAYKCSAAFYIFQNLKNLCLGLGALSGLELLSAAVVPVVAGFAGLLPAAFTPIGFVAFVGAIIAIGVLSIIGIGAAIGMANYLETNKQDIICAMYNSGSSSDAITALAGFIEDAIQFGVAGAGLGAVLEPLVADLLSTAFANTLTNGLVEPLFKLAIDIAIPDTGDCSFCSGADLLVLTSQFNPYDVVQAGDTPPRLDGFSQSPTYGWEVHYGSSDANRLAIGFTPDVAVVTLNLKYQIYGVSGAGLTTVLISTYGGGQQIETEQWDDLTGNGTWVDVEHQFACALSANTHYEILVATEFDQNARFRYIRLAAVVA